MEVIEKEIQDYNKVEYELNLNKLSNKEVKMIVKEMKYLISMSKSIYLTTIRGKIINYYDISRCRDFKCINLECC